MNRLFIIFICVLSFSFNSKSHAKEPSPIVSGYIFEHESKVLSSTRRYMVDLPENYNDNQFEYPVLYVIDADFQFQHISAIAKNMARMGKVPPMIVVGIANQGNADYVYQTTWQVDGEKDFGGAEKFHQYISSELVPTIDGAYRTNDNRILSGYSLGGFFTSYSMLQKDTPFNAFLAMSPSYWVDNYSAKNKIIAAIKQRQQSGQLAPLFLSVANEQGMGVKEVAAALEALAIKDWRFEFKELPDENHFSTALPAFVSGLEFLFPDYYLDSYTLMEHKELSTLLAAFKQKKQGYNGFQISWLQAYKLSKYMFHSKQLNKVPDLLAAIKMDFSESIVSVTNYLALGFNKTGRHQKALDILSDIKSEAKNSALWHHQYSLALTGVDKAKEAKNYQEKAMKLASEQSLPMWQVWEMK